MFLADSAVIYGEASGLNSLTSASTGWTAALNLTADAFIPTTAANASGEIGYTGGAFTFFMTDDALSFTNATNIWTVGSTGDTITITPALTLGSTLAIGGALTGATTISQTHSAPTLTMNDSTADDGTGNILFASGTAGKDIVATFQVDIANAATTMMTLDGTNEEILFAKKIDLTSAGIENVGAIADDASFTIIGAAAATVTVEGTVFDGTDITTVGGIDGSGTFSANLFAPDSAGGADIGTTDLEFNDIFLNAGGVINWQDGQEVTLTGSASGLTLNLDLVVSGGDLDFGAVAVGIGAGTETSITFDTDGNR